MTTYTTAEPEMIEVLTRATALYHRDLDAHGVRVGVVVAMAKTDESGDPVGPALKHRGVPALAKVRIVSHKDRVQGMPDAEIVLDGDRWVLLSGDERLAVMDHELTHLELVEKEGVLSVDDGGRPKLKMRLHDHEYGWFDEVAERHGRASVEVQQAQALIDGHGQVYFPFLAEANVSSDHAITVTNGRG